MVWKQGAQTTTVGIHRQPQCYKAPSWQRPETRADYTIFPVSTAAIERVISDRTGPGHALRLLARPRGGGQEEILDKRSNLMARIKERCGPSRREAAEVQTWEGFKTLKGRVIVEGKEEALRAAKEWENQLGTV